MFWIPGHYTGLSISSKEITYAAVHKKGRKAAVKQSGVIPLPPGVFSDGIVQDSSALKEVLRTAVRSNKLNRTLAVAALNTRQTVVRYLKMPAMPAKDLLQALRWETERFPFLTGSPFTLDYLKTGEWEENGNIQQGILVMAAKDSTLHELCYVLRNSGLRLKAIDIEPMAYLYLRAFGGITEIWPKLEENWAGIELGVDKTVVSFYSEYNLQFVHTIPLAYMDDPYIIEDILREVQRSFDYYHLNMKRPLPGSVYLWGDTRETLMEDTIRAFEDVMPYNFAVLPLTPLAESLGLTGDLPRGIELALGLALREVLP